MSTMRRVRVVDSHTGGEPTRLVVEGGPDLGDGPLAVRVRRFRENFDPYRSAIVNEPRGSDPMVGALLCEPHEDSCDVGVIFFNNIGYLGMCGHGTIGLVASLAHLGRLRPGAIRIDTPVGVVDAALQVDGSVSLVNVPSYRRTKDVTVEVDGLGAIRGDVAWGGNWFFLAELTEPRIELANVDRLTDLAWRIRQAVNTQGFPAVDHVELCAASPTPGANSRNFVLCPGRAYDRSPCGTGTSARLACLAADGALAEGDAWVQEGVIGTKFTGRFRWLDRAKGEVAPTITGTGHVNGEAVLLLDQADPFCWGIR
jgi:4-hydroxyproline epimerase